MPLLFISIFFTLDRIIALTKEVEELIKSKSILFYYEQEDIKPSLLLNEIREIKYLESTNTGEIELVKQMVIRLRLNLDEEFLRLSEIYFENEYEQYVQFVQGNVYFIKFESITRPNFASLKSILMSILDKPNQKIFIPKIYEEYAFVLASLGEIEESKKVIDDVSDYLTEETLQYFEKLYITNKEVNKNI